MPVNHERRGSKQASKQANPTCTSNPDPSQSNPTEAPSTNRPRRSHEARDALCGERRLHQAPQEAMAVPCGQDQALVPEQLLKVGRPPDGRLVAFGGEDLPGEVAFWFSVGRGRGPGVEWGAWGGCCLAGGGRGNGRVSSVGTMKRPGGWLRGTPVTRTCAGQYSGLQQEAALHDRAPPNRILLVGRGVGDGEGEEPPRGLGLGGRRQGCEDRALAAAGYRGFSGELIGGVCCFARGLQGKGVVWAQRRRNALLPHVGAPTIKRPRRPRARLPGKERAPLTLALQIGFVFRTAWLAALVLSGLLTLL